MNLNIKEISTKKEIKEFIRFPDRLYSGNKYYIPAIKRIELQTLSFDKNPAFEFCRAKYWFAIRNGVIVGRMTIFNDAYKSTNINKDLLNRCNIKMPEIRKRETIIMNKLKFRDKVVIITGITILY
jgi:hypothetical protein